MSTHFPALFFSLFYILFLSTDVMGQSTKGGENPCIENMSTDERNKLALPEEGKLIFNTTTGCLNYFQAKRWRTFCETEKKESGRVIFDNNTGKLQYEINGQWYTFSVVGPSDVQDEAPVQQSKTTETSTTPQAKSVKSDIDCAIKPTRPWAGKDLVSFDKVELEANKPSHGVGFWRVMKGEGGHFIDSTVSNTTFIGTQGVTYHLRWTIATQCDTFFDEALVRIRPPCDPEPSQSFAGSDQLNVESAFLSANNPRVGEGSWIIVSGLGGRVMDPGNPKSAFTGTKGETYVLRWIVRTECGLTQDDVIISFKPPCRPEPSMADAGPDQIDIETCKLDAEHPQFGKGRWRIVSGKNGRLENADTNNSRFYGEAGATYVLRWMVSTKCGSTTDTVVVKFNSYCPETFVDLRDGTTYKSMRLGRQCWMTENLKYRKDEMEVYCYDGYEQFCREFGGLYTWKAAMNGKTEEKSRGACPEGWHVPTDKEWQTLMDSSGFSTEDLLNDGKSGFEIKMGGTRYTNGKFFNRNEYAYFWSSSQMEENKAWNRYFPKKNGTADHFATSTRHGFSVRCIKDEE